MKHRYYPILLLYFFQVACMLKKISLSVIPGKLRSILSSVIVNPAGRSLYRQRVCFRYPKICKSTFQKK